MHNVAITLREVTHENWRAQQLYTSLGFQPDGRELWGEPVYSLPIQ